MDNPKRYSTAAIARICHVTQVTVGDWIRSGKLKGILVGGRYFVEAAELNRFTTAQADFDEFEQEVSEIVKHIIIDQDWPKISEQIGTGQPWQEITVPCIVARVFVPQIADPLHLMPNVPEWLKDHVASCRSCQVKLKRLDEVSQTIEYTQTCEIPKAVYAAATSDDVDERMAAEEIIGQVHILDGKDPGDLTCQQIGSYYWHMAICELNAYAPPERYQHAMECDYCKEKISWLRDQIGITAPKVGSKEFAQLMMDKFKERPPEDQPVTAELLKSHNVDCELVRPLLNQLADPLELVLLPRWIEAHVQDCEDCKQEYTSLYKFNEMLDVIDMARLNWGSVVKKLFPDTKPEMVEKAEKFAEAHNRSLTCFSASRYYHDMARCDLESHAPAETYLHVRYCPSCSEHVRQLYYRLGMAVPQLGSPEFEELRAGTRSIPLVPAPKRSADGLGSTEYIQLRDQVSKSRLRLMPAAVKAGGSAAVLWAGKRAQSARQMSRTVKPATLLKYAAVLMLLVGGWLLVNPAVASDDVLADMVNGFKGVRNVCVQVFRAGQKEPFRKEWLSADLNVRLRERVGQRLILQDFNNKITRTKELDSGQIKTEPFPPKAATDPTIEDRLTNFSVAVVPFQSISDMPKDSKLKEITDPKVLKGLEPGIEVYEVSWNDKDERTGEFVVRIWRGYIRPIDDQTKQLLKFERWHKDPLVDKEAVFERVFTLSYPTTDQVRLVVERSGLAED